MTFRFTGAFIALLALLLAACSNQPTPTPQPTEPAAPEETTEAAPDEASAATIDDIVNITWQWESLQDASGQNNITVDDPNLYTVAFLPDGALQIQADCNVAGGSYTADGSSLTVEVGFTSLAFCGEDSLDQTFTTRLDEVAAFVLDGDRLVLNLMADAGNLVFRNGGPVADEEAAESEDDLLTDLITLDPQGLYDTWEAQVVEATPYDDSMPPGPMGLPRHIQITFGSAGDPSDLSSDVMFIIPVDAYRELWDTAGNSAVSDAVDAIYDLSVALPTPAPLSGLPVLPYEAGVVGINDVAAQLAHLPVVETSAAKNGFRFVGRFAQDPNPVLADDLRYIYQGFTNDGRFLVSFLTNVNTTQLPETMDALTAEQQEQFNSDPFATIQATTEQLNNSAPGDWQPNLDALDALIASLQIDGMRASGLEGQAWEWTGAVANPQTGEVTTTELSGTYTIAFNRDGTYTAIADCNTLLGNFDADGGIAGRVAKSAGPSTLVACGPDSQFDTFSNLLLNAQSYRVRPGGEVMELSLPTGQGDYIFANLGPSDGIPAQPDQPIEVPTPETGAATGRVIATQGVNVRTGPGTAYPVLGLASFGTEGEIIGRSADGAWWVASVPGAPNNQGWVAAAYVAASNAENVPIIPAPPLPVVPTPTPLPTATPAPFIQFTADRTNINAGECTTLRWDVENIQAVWVYPQGEPFNQYPVTGQGSQEVCPARTSTYEMRVLRTDNTVEIRQITINVQRTSEVVGTSWQLLALRPGQSVLPGTSLTLTFSQNQVSGSGGCNSFSGPYTVSGINISIGPLTSGRAACGAEIDAQEQTYFSSLQSAATYTVNITQLIMRDSAGQDTLRFGFTGDVNN